MKKVWKFTNQRELTEKEFRILRSQFVTSNKDKMGLCYLPYAFTEDGIAQLSTGLNSESAIKINIQIRGRTN